MTDYLFNEEVINAAYKKSIRDEAAEEATQFMLASLVNRGLLSPEHAAEEASCFRPRGNKG